MATAAGVKTGADAKGAFVVALVLVGIASLVGSPGLGWAVSPIVIILFCYAAYRAALVDTMLVLMFFALALENPAEIPGAGAWESPFKTFGGLMLTHFKTIIGGPWFFGGMDILLVVAMIVAYLRRPRSLADRATATPRPMVLLAYLSLATVPWVFIVGWLRPGFNQSMALWQADRVTYLPIVFLLFAAALRGPMDHIRVGKVLLAAGTLRACQAMYVQSVVDLEPDPLTGDSSLVYATTHNDSITFALATVVLAALVIQRVGKPATRLTLLLLPVLVGGMLANNRRMVWVQIILVLATVYFVTERNTFKRKLERWLLYLAPAIIGYVVVGWNSKASHFKPVQTIRSAVDAETDASTLWREIENYDLVATFHNYPVFGSGYGHPFWEVIPLPEVAYELERFIPHNSVLAMWAFYGLIGVIGITSLWAAGVYFGVRAYHHCQKPIDKAAALVSFAAVLVYLVQCFGDLGLGCWAGVFTVAPSLAVACKLAVSSGAWVNEARGKRPAAARAAAPAAGTHSG